MLMSPKLKLLVAALLGADKATLAQAFLFNDQVYLSMLLFHMSWSLTLLI